MLMKTACVPHVNLPCLLIISHEFEAPNGFSAARWSQLPPWTQFCSKPKITQKLQKKAGNNYSNSNKKGKEEKQDEHSIFLLKILNVAVAKQLNTSEL